MTEQEMREEFLERGRDSHSAGLDKKKRKMPASARFGQKIAVSPTKSRYSKKNSKT